MPASVDAFTYCGETSGYTPPTPGQVAILIVRAGCLLSPYATMRVEPGIRVGGASFNVGTPTDAQNASGTLSSMTANTGTGTYALSAGTEYFFSTAFRVNAASALCSCQTIVQIIQGEAVP